jgi:hypothetical protein
MAVKNKNKFLTQDGQAIIEMVLFFPLLILLFIYFLNITASINGSINQQKVTRSYFFARLKNNSLFPFSYDIRLENWPYVGMGFIGWKEKFSDGDEPFLACYQAKVPFFSTEETTCSSQYQGNNTNYIRVGTVFGVCGATYQKGSAGEYHRGILKEPKEVASWGACTIVQ